MKSQDLLSALNRKLKRSVAVYRYSQENKEWTLPMTERLECVGTG